MNKPASKQLVISSLMQSMDYGIEYMKAVRSGETDEAERIEKEWSEWLKQLSREATK